MPTGYREVSLGRISLSSSMPLLSKRDGRDLRLRRNTVPVKHSLDRWKKLRPPSSFGTWPIWKRRTPTVPQWRKGVKLVSARTTVRCPLPPIPVSKLRTRAEKENSSSFLPPFRPVQGRRKKLQPCQSKFSSPPPRTTRVTPVSAIR